MTADLTLAHVSTPLPSAEGGVSDVYLPLGPLYLTSTLEAAGYEVDLRDYQLFVSDANYPLDLECLHAFLDGAAPVLAISCMVSMLPFVLLGTRSYKEKHPESTIILGGPGPSGVAEAIIRDMPWIDIVGRGEGEATLLELAGALENGGDLGTIDGITYRTGSEVRHNPPRARNQDIDSIPWPAYHRIPFSRYTDIPVITGRGCPFQCAFCDVGPLWGNRVTYRSVAAVIEEIAHLKSNYGVSDVHLADDTFNLKRERAVEMCTELGRLGLTWSCLARVDLIDEELLAMMVDAGCKRIFLGIESGSDRIRKKIGKALTIREATERVALCTRHLDKVVASYIWGFPYETMEDFKATLFSVYAMGQLGALVGLKLLSPMPLSRLGVEYRDQLRFSDELCSVFAALGNRTREPSERRAAIPEELQAIILEHPDIFGGFYHIWCDSMAEKVEYLKRFSRKLGVQH
jgi:radical SAM superfamily enzyme YgiQ (UPF0313 family)